MIIRIINWLFKNKREDSFELKKKEEKRTKLINKIKDDLNLIKINENKMTNILTRIIKKAKSIKKNKVNISKIINRIEKKKIIIFIIKRSNEIINETKEYIEFKNNKDLINKIIREKRIESAWSAERDDEIINEIKKYIEQINKYNMLFEIINNINEILAYITEGVKDALNNSIKISGIKFFSYINSQISKASLLISFNYLVQYNLKKIYLENLGVFTQIGRDRLYPTKWLGKSLLWDLLPNSGDFLKILVLSHYRKIMNKWANYSCIVINQIISSPLAMKMDNRGSNSEECLVFKSSIAKHDTVKEQRVYGNLNGNYIPFLICTLVRFERNSQFKIPFKSINNFRLYNSISTQQSEIKLNMLTPVALAHVIMGDGNALSHGLIICTNSYSVVRLINVIIIKYKIECTIQLKKQNNKIEYMIYIRQASMVRLWEIVSPYMHYSMYYKLKKQ
jgi:hypothetical protein